MHNAEHPHRPELTGPARGGHRGRLTGGRPPRENHLSDDTLLEICVTGELGEFPTGLSDVTAAHLRACGSCGARFNQVSRWLATARDDGRAVGDGAFTDAALARQRAAVLQQLEALDGSARVLTFPAAPQPASIPRRTAMRWISAAAAAGLILGVGAGRLLELPPSRPARTAERLSPRAPVAGMTRGTAVPGLRGMHGTGSTDEAFLVEIDTALNSTRVRELQAIDALTPRVREMAVNLR